MRSAGLFAVSAVLALGLAHSRAQDRTTNPQTPDSTHATFKAGIDLVQLDVSVLDRNNRPVHGLTASDFTVLEEGTPRQIVAFLPIDVPGPIAPAVAWLRDIGADVVSNDLDTRRLVVIVMDDAYTGIDRGESKSAREVGRAIVEQLGPADLAAVAFTFLGRAQNFTPDRAQLLAAIESYTPRNWSLHLKYFPTNSRNALQSAGVAVCPPVW